MIKGEDATNLYVTCIGNGDCDNSRITCLKTEGSECNIVCVGPNSWFETAIHSTINTHKHWTISESTCAFAAGSRFYHWELVWTYRRDAKW